MSEVLRVNDLKVSFSGLAGEVEVLKGISFRICAGDTVALVGESGSGKSVTAQAIMGILPKNAKITGGSIDYCDPEHHAAVATENGDMCVRLSELPPASKEYRSIRGDRISMIFQEPMTSLSPLHTIGNQIQEALHLHRKMEKKHGKEVTIETLRLVGFPDPEGAYDRYPFELSGGLRQRAMIAMSLVCRPSLLIADEPTTALDVTIQAQIIKLILDLQKQLDMAVLIITHDLGVVANMADEIVVMYHGRIVEAGTRDDIFRNPQHPYLKGLLSAVPHFGMKKGERLRSLREIETGKSDLMFECREPEADGGDDTVLELKNISKSYIAKKGGGKLFSFNKQKSIIKAVNDVSLKIKRGTCVGLVGESGCGKTTLSKMIMGDIKPDGGEILYSDQGKKIDFSCLKDKDFKEYRSKVQYVFQDPFSSLNPRMSVFDILTEPLRIHKIGTPEEQAKMAADLLKLVGLPANALSRYPHSFSGGQRQRLGIARALAISPDLILCDEPVSALDVSVQAQVLNLFKDLQAKFGLTYLFISHNLAVVDYIADTIAVMCAGRLVELAPKEALFNNPSHPYTKALLAAVPYPDPDRSLDFDYLMQTKASNPANWEGAFGIHPEFGEPGMIEVEEDHFVRAHAVEEVAS